MVVKDHIGTVEPDYGDIYRQTVELLNKFYILLAANAVKSEQA